jgi:NTE family protein
MRIAFGLSLAALGVLAACSYPTRNVPLAASGPAVPYTWESMRKAAPDDMPETLIVVTASGGGTRATALAMTVLETLGHIKLPNGKSMADEVDVVSSVSGGSVAAGYFALHGAAGLPVLEKDFVRRDGIGRLLLTGANPVGLAELALPSKERIDLLIDYLDSSLFHDATFADLAGQKRRPYLMLDSADMVEGVPFPFTQYTFDLLCSDLSKFKLSTAVAASAAFPVALSPVTLTNYSARGECPQALPPPAWVAEVLQDHLNNDPAAWEKQQIAGWHLNPERVAQARVARAYATGAKQYVHLLDGGIADNLGVAEPYRLLTNLGVTPPLLGYIEKGAVKRIIFIMVNARSFPVSDLDQQQATPSMLSMGLGSIDSAIDRATAGSAARVKQLLVEALKAYAAQARPFSAPLADHLEAAANDTTFLAVDFDAIPSPSCRQRFHSIPTSWTLSPAQIDGVEAMGEALLGADDDFTKVVADLGGTVERPIVSIDQACQVYPATAH